MKKNGWKLKPIRVLLKALYSTKNRKNLSSSRQMQIDYFDWYNNQTFRDIYFESESMDFFLPKFCSWFFYKPIILRVRNFPAARKIIIYIFFENWSKTWHSPVFSYTHSSVPFTETDLGDLIIKSRTFIEKKISENVPDFTSDQSGQSNTDLLKTLFVLARNPRSFYDKGTTELEKGDLWAEMTNNGQDKSLSKMLDYDKSLSVHSGESVSIKHGTIGMRSKYLHSHHKYLFKNSK